jgi:Arc/MetJ family transcription regulator
MATRLFNRLSDFHLSNKLALKAMFDKICGQVESQFDQVAQNVTDIAAAEADIAAVVADVAALSSEVDTIGTDSILSKVEKLIVIRGVNDIINEKSGLDTQATALGITTEKTAYDSAYTTLVNYLAGLSPAYTDTTQNTTIVRATWNTNFNGYYSARIALLNKMDDVNYSTASGALTAITNITTDSVLDKGEKQQLVQIVNNIINEKSGLDTQATTLGITTEKTTYDTAYTALVTTYLGGLSPAYTDTTQNTTIVRSTFNTKFNDYYTARAALVNKMADVASAQSVVIDPFPSVTIYADSTGAVKSGQLTKTVQLTASKGGSAVTTLGTWSRTSVSGVTCTIGASTGSVSITALTGTDVSVPISFTYLGVTRTATLRIIRQDDPPTNSGGSGATGGTTASTTTLGDTTGTSYDLTNAISDTLTVTAGSVGQVACTAPLMFDRVTTSDGQTGAYGKWQWRVPAGVWADITTETQETDTAVNDAANIDNDHYGSMSVSHTKTGLTPSSSYEFRFAWRDRSAPNASRVTRVSGTLTATGT